MSKIKAVIIDDELGAITTLSSMIGKYCPEVEILGAASNVPEAVKLINDKLPNLVFLDINMPGANGFELLKSEDIKGINFDVIFTTAYSEYAIQAIKQSALDYLLKPIDSEELKLAISKFIENLGKKKLNSFDMEAINSIFSDTGKTKKIGVSTKEGIEYIDVDDVIYCESSRNYTIYHLLERKIVVSKTLGDVESSLNKYSFFRIHKSYLINTTHVKKYVRGRGGQVIMSNEADLDVSRERKDRLMQLLNE